MCCFNKQASGSVLSLKFSVMGVLINNKGIKILLHAIICNNFLHKWYLWSLTVMFVSFMHSNQGAKLVRLTVPTNFVEVEGNKYSRL